MRGEHGHARLPTRHHAGIIPACAGNTVDGEEAHRIGEGSSPHARGTRPCTAAAKRPCRDHPRMRGEHGFRVRVPVEVAGIIPACAGNTSPRGLSAFAGWGSSPHARGTRPSWPRQQSGLRDHPRMRGEHGFRVRVPVEVARIIPACAGNTGETELCDEWCPGSSPHARGTRARWAASTTCPRDHPRMRGEHARMTNVGNATARIIPACAGNTWLFAVETEMASGSSPHARGTPCTQTAPSVGTGDHPRMRGEHHERVDARLVDVGIIPACAGNTLIYLRSQFPTWQFCITLSKATGLVPLACIAPA